MSISIPSRAISTFTIKNKMLKIRNGAERKVAAIENNKNRHLEVLRVPANLVDVGQRAAVVRSLTPGQTDFLSLKLVTQSDKQERHKTPESTKTMSFKVPEGSLKKSSRNLSRGKTTDQEQTCVRCCAYRTVTQLIL